MSSSWWQPAIICRQKLLAAPNNYNTQIRQRGQSSMLVNHARKTAAATMDASSHGPFQAFAATPACILYVYAAQQVLLLEFAPKKGNKKGRNIYIQQKNRSGKTFRLCSVVVITPDSESGDPSSTLGTASIFLLSSQVCFDLSHRRFDDHAH